MNFLFLTGIVILATVCETAYSFPGRRDSQVVDLFITQPSPIPDDAANNLNNDNGDNRNSPYLPSNGISQPREERALPGISFLGKISKTKFVKNSKKTYLNPVFNTQMQSVNQNLWNSKKYRILNKTQFHSRNQKARGSSNSDERNNSSYQKHRSSTKYTTTGNADRQQFSNRIQVHTFQSLGTSYPGNVALQSTPDYEDSRHFQNRVNSFGNSPKRKQVNRVFGLHDNTLVSNQRSVVSSSNQTRDKYPYTSYQRHQNSLIRKGQEQSKNRSYMFVLEHGKKKSTLLMMPRKSLTFDAPTLVSKSSTQFPDKENSLVSVLDNSIGFKDYHNLQTKDEPENDNTHTFMRFEPQRIHVDRSALILDKLTDPLESPGKNKEQPVDSFVNSHKIAANNLDESDQNPQMDSLSQPSTIFGNARSASLQPDEVTPTRKTEALTFDLETYAAFNQPTLGVENNVQRNNETWKSNNELNLNKTSEYQHQGTRINAADNHNITVPKYTKSSVFHTHTLNKAFGDISISSQRSRNGNKENEVVSPNEGIDQEHDMTENRFSINEHHAQGQENEGINTDVQRNSEVATLRSYNPFPIGNELSVDTLNLTRNLKGAALEVSDGVGTVQSVLPSVQSYTRLNHFKPIDTAGTVLQPYATQSQDDNRESTISVPPAVDLELDLTSYHRNPTQFQNPRYNQNSQSSPQMGGSDREPLGKQSLFHGVIPQNYDTMQQQDFIEPRTETIQSDSLIENETEYMMPSETYREPEQSFDDHNVRSELQQRNYHNYLDKPKTLLSIVEDQRNGQAHNVFDYSTTRASRETRIIDNGSQEHYTEDNFYNSQDQYLQQNGGNEDTYDNYQVSDNARQMPSDQYYTQNNFNKNIYEPFNNQGTANVMNSDNDNELIEYNSSFESNEYNSHMPTAWGVANMPNQENVLWNMPATWNLDQASGNTDYVDERSNENTEQSGKQRQETNFAAGLIDGNADEDENTYDYDLNEPSNNAGHYNGVNREHTARERPTQEYQWYTEIN